MNKEGPKRARVPYGSPSSTTDLRRETKAAGVYKGRKRTIDAVAVSGDAATT